jgi:ferritin-like metal-binding protein YciE
MPLQQQLIVHLQEVYALECDYQNYLRTWNDRVRDQEFRFAIDGQIDSLGWEAKNIQQCLHALGSVPDGQPASHIVQGLRQEDEALIHNMPAMTPADSDLFLAMTESGMGQFEIGLYQGMLSIAKTLNQLPIVDLLQKNLEHQEREVRKVQELLPELVKESQALSQ